MTTATLTIPGWEFGSGKPCCAVLACAVAAQRPFQDAWQWMKKRKSARWKGGMFNNDIIELLEGFNVKYKRVPDCKGRTLGAFAKQATPGTLYYVVTTRHAQTLLNGTVMDQRGPKPVAEFWGRRKKIEWVLEIDTGGQDPMTFGLPLFDFK
jgi:hypothetical protein